jgi:hypothetical protein
VKTMTVLINFKYFKWEILGSYFAWGLFITHLYLVSSL